MTNFKTILLILVATLLLAPTYASAVDGVVEINAAKVQAAGGYPYQVTQPGSYRLTSDLRVSDPSLSAIKVTSSFVTIDLNGFSIVGPGSGSGIGIDATLQPVITIHDGEVAGMGGGGIKTGHSSQIHHMRVLSNGGSQDGFGIWCTDACLISSNIVNNNGGNGIQVLINDSPLTGGAARIIDNVAQHNQGLGIVGGGVINGNMANDNAIGFYVLTDTVLTNNRARDNGSFGLVCNNAGDVAYSNNLFNENNLPNGPGVEVLGADSCIQTGPNVCNGSLCP